MDPHEAEHHMRVAERAERLAKERMEQAGRLSDEDREELERRAQTAHQKLIDALREVRLAEGFDPPRDDEPASFHDRSR